MEIIPETKQQQQQNCVELKAKKIDQTEKVKSCTKIKSENMESPNLDTALKPTLSSTKSIDEGFESDPDREQSNAESESNQLPIDAQPTFDILQRTDRDGVQHTQITRRTPNVDIAVDILNGRRINNKRELDKNRIVYTNNSNKVAIPRANGGIAIANNQRIIKPATHPTIHAPFNAITANNISASITDQRHHRYAGKVVGELSNSRLAKATDLVLRSSGVANSAASGSGRERLNFPTTMSNVSQVALINGKLICVNMPVTQIIPMSAASSASHSTKRHLNNTGNTTSSLTMANGQDKMNGSMQKHQPYAIGSVNNHHLNAAHHQHHHQHHQKYISNGRCPANESASIAQQVNNAIIQNANSSNTFYPAQGNISLISSQYGLKYKSTHLSGMQEQPVPVPLWSQTLARQKRR